MTLLEPSFNALWGGRQVAQGTPLDTPTRRFQQVSGDFAGGREDGREDFSDMSKYGSGTDYVNSITGQGEPAIQFTPDNGAWLLCAFHGSETVTAVTGPPAVQKHSFSPSLATPWWLSFHRRVGNQVTQRHRYNDCRITRVQIEGSTANKVVRITPRIISLDPLEVRSSDPVLGMPTQKALVYTDGAGAYTIDGIVFRGQSQFTIVIDDAWEASSYGDDIVPYDFSQGNPSVTVAASVWFDPQALARWNFLMYGTPTPAAGTKPLRNIPSLGAYSVSLKQRDGAGVLNGLGMDISIPKVKWAIPPAPAPNNGGGATEIALAGEMRPEGGVGYTIDVFTANTTTAFTS